LVEHTTENRGVGGSTPPLTTSENRPVSASLSRYGAVDVSAVGVIHGQRAKFVATGGHVRTVQPRSPCGSERAASIRRLSSGSYQARLEVDFAPRVARSPVRRLGQEVLSANDRDQVHERSTPVAGSARQLGRSTFCGTRERFSIPSLSKAPGVEIPR
jgi:hypothetical protein